MSNQMDPSDQAAVRAIPGNRQCAECGTRNPEWASVSFGTVFCLECSGVHRGLGVHISFVRSIKMDSWTPKQLALMMAGGNNRCSEYLENTGIAANSSIKAKYESPQAQHYKEVLKARVNGLPDPPFVSPSVCTTLGLQQQTSPVFEGADIVPSRGVIFFILLGSIADKSLLSALRKPFHFVIGCTLALIGGSFIAPELWSILRTFLLFVIGVVIFMLVLGILGLYMFSGRMIKRRQPAFKSARNLLSERIKNGRAQQREAGFDLFLPPNVSAKTGGTVSIGLIFFPGASIENTAYGPVAAALSDAGFLVAVVNLDPLRLAAVKGCTKQDILGIMTSISAGVGCINVSEWAIGGHSLGAAAAANIIQDLNGVRKLVLCGFATSKAITHSLREAKVDALVINATNDAFYCHHKLDGTFDALKLLLPPEKKEDDTSSTHYGTTAYSLIEGGNHSGFAHYGPQVFPMKDGERTITLDEQQTLCTTMIVDFFVGQ